jgi:hypothetical protein
MVLDNTTAPLTAVDTVLVTYALQYILLSIILGILGQFIRIGIGLKKQFEEGKEFDYNKLKASIMIAAFVGATAGVLYIIENWTQIAEMGGSVNQNFLLTLISIGYAGTDFVEALLNKEKGEILKKYTEQEYKDKCLKERAAIDAGKFDTNVLKMEVDKKV